MTGQVLYRVERAGSEELGFPVSLNEALKQVRRRVPNEHEGALKIARVEYRLDPEQPPTICTSSIRRAWRATILRFPDIGWLGTYVCKDKSQHRYGNATDWAAGLKCKTSGQIISYLDDVADWQVQQCIRGDLDLEQIIWRDDIWTPSAGWHPCPSCPFHAAHVHDSGSPLIDTSRPCGKVR